MMLDECRLSEIFPADTIQRMRLVHYKRNAFLFREAHPATDFLVMVKGSVKVYLTTGNGKSLLLTFYGPGSVMGDVELFSGTGATSNVQAITDVSCLAIDMNWLRWYVGQDNAFLQTICKSLAVKLDRSSKNSSINLLYPLENRLARYIVEMAAEMPQGKVFHENLSNVSDLLGTSYRHLLRTLQIFVREGLLKKEEHQYLLSDVESLKRKAIDVYL